MNIESFTVEQIGSFEPSPNWVFNSGFFGPERTSEVLGYRSDTGELWVGLNKDEQANLKKWAQLEPNDGWEFVCGNFINERKTDVVGYHPSNGSLWIGENLGDHFEFRPWGNVQPASGWQFTCLTTETKDGRCKSRLFGHHIETGSVWLSDTNSTQLNMSQIGNVTPGIAWKFLIDNFDGYGYPDLVAYNSEDGTLWASKNILEGFKLRQYENVNLGTNAQICSGNFLNASKSGLFVYLPGQGSIVIGEDRNSNFVLLLQGSVDSNEGWNFVPFIYEFNPSHELIGLGRNGTAWIFRMNPPAIQGYCWPLSAAPEERIGFYFNGSGNARIIFKKLSSNSLMVDTVGAGEVEITIMPQSPIAGRDVQADGYGWSETYFHLIPAGWESGIYLAECSNGITTCNITFIVIVKPTSLSGGFIIPEVPIPGGSSIRGQSREGLPSFAGDVALIVNVNTWLAYSTKYDSRGSARGSFLRPSPMINELNPFHNENAHLIRGELWILGWLESIGVRPHLFTDIDFHNIANFGGYKLIILSTHPEYWSHKMYDNLKAYLANGGNLAYLGGNGVFERAEYYPDQTGMTFREGVVGGTRYRSFLRMQGKPELEILGVATERCGVIGSPYQVKIPRHELFEGTGLNTLDAEFGNSGYCIMDGAGNGKASGWEVDTSDGPGARSITSPNRSCYYHLILEDGPNIGDCYPNPIPSVPIAELPAGLEILAQGIPDADGLGADMTYYVHPTGRGFVFSVGSITFGGSLVHPNELGMKELMKNVIRKAGIMVR